MRLIPTVICLLMACAGGASAALADCQKMPKPVADYLQANPTWKLLQLHDLDAGNQAFWRKSPMARECPGLARLDINGDGMVSFALALLSKDKSGAGVEQIVLLQPAVTAPVILEKSDHWLVGSAIYRVPPGRYFDHVGGAWLHIKADGLIRAHFESEATLYYYLRGRPTLRQISD